MKTLVIVARFSTLMTISFLATLAIAAGEGDLTPAQLRIQQAERLVSVSPKSADAHNRLALAYSQRARETADPSFYDKSLEALERSLGHAPENFTAEKLRVWVLLGKHQFREALTKARELNRRVPDDLFVYGLLTDALVELGEYGEAEKMAQWMLDLRPGDVSALTRGAYLREHFGDIEGALEWMQASYEQTYFHEVETRAWILTQMAQLERSRGGVAEAEILSTKALELFPDYHYALRELALVRLAQRRTTEATRLLSRRYELAPHPENLFDLAESLRRGGRDAEAMPFYRDFETAALSESDNHDNANRELVFYYADVKGESSEALRIAEMETTRRADVFTLDAYAWALFRAGRAEEAWKQMEVALEHGIQRASLFFHAGSIAGELGDDERSRRFFEKSLALEPFSEFAPTIQASLDSSRLQR